MTEFNKRIWGWMFFDWASQPYFTLLLTFVFAPYFTSTVVGDAALGQEYWGWMLTVVGITLAVLAPVLGAVADGTGSRQAWITVFAAMCAAGSFALWWALPGGAYVWPLVFIGIGVIGAELAQIFVNAMLPGLGSDKQIGVISGSGWAFGYAGGIISLALVLLLLAEDHSGTTLLGNAPIFGLDPDTREGTRSVGPFTAIWFVIFMLPFYFWTGDTPQRKARDSLGGLINTIRKLPEERSLLAFLGSSMFYRDALNGLYAFGGIYAAGVLEWSIVQVGVFGVISLVFGTIFAWIGGFADSRWGPKPVIAVAATALIIVCVVILATSRDSFFGVSLAADSSLPGNVFLVCGCIIGGAGGTIQAASRTMMVRQANPERMTEAFGLYAFSGKATAFLAPFLVALVTGMTGSQQLGITPLVLLFAVGLVLLHWVRAERPPSSQQP